MGFQTSEVEPLELIVTVRLRVRRLKYKGKDLQQTNQRFLQRGEKLHRRPYLTGRHLFAHFPKAGTEVRHTHFALVTELSIKLTSCSSSRSSVNFEK